MAEFSVIVSDLRAKADELESLNQQLMAEINNLESTESSLNGMWEGDARETFHTAFASDVVQMHNFYNAIIAYVNVLRSNIAKYEAMEAQNVDIASTRTY